MSNQEYLQDGHAGVDRDCMEMGVDVYRTYLNRVYSAVVALKPGQSIDIQARSTAKTRGRFVRALWLFIQDGGEAVFSDDYSKIIRISTPVIETKKVEKRWN